MSKSKIHVVILDPQYAKDNSEWIQQFVFHNEENSIHFFSCGVVQASQSGFLEFLGVPTKSNDEKEDILLPHRAVVGVFLDQSHKNQLGFLDQKKSPEQL